VTTRAIRERGYVEAVEADPHDVAGLVAAIRGYVHEHDARRDESGA
jgi:hypothetical protein